MNRSVLPLVLALAFAIEPTRGSAATCDFNGDGVGDIVTRIGSHYRVRIWDGSEVLETSYRPRGGSQMDPICGDVDGDGNSDLVFSSQEAIRVDFMDGAMVKDQRYFGTAGGVYKAYFAEDLDGDGRAELIERSWTNDPANPLNALVRITKLDAVAQAVESRHFIDTGNRAFGLTAIANLDGDALADFVSRGDDVHATRIDLNPLGVHQTFVIPAGVARVAGVGDLDGDGKDDLVSNGPSFIRIDRMDGASILETGYLGNAGGLLDVMEDAPLGDLDGDGRADLVAGFVGFTLRVDLMDGVTSTAQGFVHIGASGTWDLGRGPRDLSGDGRADLLFLGPETIRIDVMSGVARIQSIYLPNWPIYD